MSLASELCFCAGSLPTRPFAELVQGAAKAGFDSMTLWPNIWRHALKKGGFTLASMKRCLDDHGVRLSGVEHLASWVPGSVAEPKAPAREELFEVCAALGGRIVSASHNPPATVERARDAGAFARLCDAAAAHGLSIALEAVSFSNLRNINEAWAIVEAAGRPNGGLTADITHHVRGHGDDAAFAMIPGDRIFWVQLCDGLREMPADLLDESTYRRLLPGEGEFDMDGWLRLMAGRGVSAPTGCEVYKREWETLPTDDVMRRLADAARGALARAGV